MADGVVGVGVGVGVGGDAILVVVVVCAAREDVLIFLMFLKIRCAYDRYMQYKVYRCIY